MVDIERPGRTPSLKVDARSSIGRKLRWKARKSANRDELIYKVTDKLLFGKGRQKQNIRVAKDGKVSSTAKDYIVMKW